MPAPHSPTCAVYIAVSIDGYIARPDGSIDWLEPMHVSPDEDYGFKAFFSSIDVLVLGRNTYDTVLEFPEWPYPGKRCVVLTHRRTDPRHGEEFFEGNVARLAEKLGSEGVRRVYVDGGDVIRQFLKAQLVDEMTLSIIPTVLGQGIRLFSGEEPEGTWKLEASRSFPTGLAQLRYTRA